MNFNCIQEPGDLHTQDTARINVAKLMVLADTSRPFTQRLSTFITAGTAVGMLLVAIYRAL